MDLSQKPTVTRMLGMVAAALALTLAGCDRNPSTGTAGDGRDRVGQDGRTLERVPGDVARRLDPTGGAIRDRSADAGKAVDDVALTARVRSALIAEPTLSKSLGIEVEASGGAVVLKGVASTNSAREKAVQIASSVEGVKSVRSDLVVVSDS